MRLFLAVDISDAMRDALTALQERLKGRWQGWRWVKPDGIHLTIRFLGEVTDDNDLRSRHLWRAAAAEIPPFDVRFGELARFPKAGRARILWVGVEELGGGSSLQALADRVERAARTAGFEPERRSFKPHLTLARAARGKRALWSAGMDFDCGVEARIDRLVLYRSQLHPAGARYTALEHFRLEGGDV
jgi:2'-5' RNA ligase